MQRKFKYSSINSPKLSPSPKIATKIWNPLTMIKKGRLPFSDSVKIL